MIHTLLEALLLVSLVVFLFLQSWRATLIPVLAIPVSIVGTFIFFIPLGFTINTLTLFGFVLAIGIVVDDAIVVVEAVQHYIDEEGLSAREATRKAMKDITAPVIAIALILAAVFMPVGFIPGIVGRLYQQFAITIAISVLLSAFVALSLTPALCALLLRPVPPGRRVAGPEPLFLPVQHVVCPHHRSYSNGVRKAIRATPLVMVLLGCIYAGTFGLFSAKPTGFIPTEDEGRLFVSFELPEGASQRPHARGAPADVEMLRTRRPACRTTRPSPGLTAINFSIKSNSGTFFVQLKPWDDRKDDSLHACGPYRGSSGSGWSAVKEANIVVVPPPAIPGLGQHGRLQFHAAAARKQRRHQGLRSAW